MSTRELAVSARSFSLQEIRNDIFWQGSAGNIQTQAQNGNRWRMVLSFIGHGDDGDKLRALQAFLKGTRNRVSVPFKSRLGYNRKGANGWAFRASAADLAWHSIAWSPDLSLFCAVASSGTGNRVMTSPDAITWTSRTSASDENWNGICWAPSIGLFIAVADNTGISPLNLVMTSPDGINWTSRAAASDGQWRDVVWSEELTLAVAVGNNSIMTSPDGITWTSRTSPATVFWTSVCWSAEKSLFVAVSTAGTAMTSPDGITWTHRTTSLTDSDWRSVTYSPALGIFCAVASAGAQRVMTSPDGITWTGRDAANNSSTWFGIVWSPELAIFVAVADTTPGTQDNVMTSTDGITWTLGTSGTNKQLRAVCWSAELNLFCAVSITETGFRVDVSVDGFTGDPLLNGSHSAGATSISLKTMPVSVTQHIKAGDFIAVGNEIKLVTSDVDSGPGGTGTADIWPELHQAYANNQLVKIVDPAGVFYNQSATVMGSEKSIPDDWLDVGYTLDLVEDITA